MANAEPRKRSRFDEEPEPVRTSRFDRRSRSPARRDGANDRSRSPIARSIESPSSTSKQDAASKAAEAAARINAQINAKKGIQHVDVPPIRSTLSPGGAKSPSASASNKDDVYTQDGDYIKDIEVNDLRNRYTLTKGSTQKMIKEETGADVTTRGNYYPDKAMATAANPPLYLHVTSTTKDGLEKAVKKINELMQQDLPNLIDERRFRRREPEQFERDHMGRRKWPEEKIPIDLEPIPGFNLRAQVVGAGGSYVKHIQQETRCRVQIKGRGSGFMEHDSGRESDEQMYLHVAGPDPSEVARAKDMCLSLLDAVKESYESFKERGPRGGGHGGDRGGYGGEDRGGYQNRDRNSGSYGGGGGGYNNNQGGYSAYGGAGSPQTPQTATAMSPGAGQAQGGYGDYNQYYAAQAAGQDPYAAYGGYEAYCQMYYQYMAQQQGQQVPGQAGSPPAQNGSAPPPPPQDNNAPPPPPPDNNAPPPPPGSSTGGYSAVPPPPGM